MKCDEFEDIHLLKTERPHPQAWNFRRTDAKLPVFGSGHANNPNSNPNPNPNPDH